ncbi:hypothetical protein SAMN05216388_101756 [Halorientalis persicus]|uniref:Homeodomain-like domain-containing protein n=1 Tax=Halorientalis persicus TaxID=1367881 RepID=A0A1H8RW49_9EURY|nr:hypothetical protein [Halorientalis persicus]SEO70582.1 hypothetical protein SAMN05216388_101756 [Halorientalis persicus]
MSNAPDGPLDDYDPDETVYATDPEDSGSVTFGSREEYDKPYKDKNWLYHQYHVLKKSMSEIADEVSITHGTIGYWMDKYDISRRDLPEAGAIAKGAGNKRYRDAGWLREQYVEREKNTPEIAEQCGVSSHTISDWLDRHGIETRSRAESQCGVVQYEELGDEEWLRTQYIDRKRDSADIAEEIGCASNSVRHALKRYDIPMRDRSEYLHLAKRQEVGTGEVEQPPEEAEDAGGDETTATQSGGNSYEGPSVGIDLSWSDSKTGETQWCPYTGEDWLRWQYHQLGNSIYEMADICGCSETTIRRWMDRFGIERTDGGPEPDT